MSESISVKAKKASCEIVCIAEARTCPYCETCIEHELHLVLQCPLYSSLRCKYVHDMYVNDVSEASCVRLMSSDHKTTVNNLAMCVHDALKERDSILEGK
mgnify:CR=1 FL=1